MDPIHEEYDSTVFPVLAQYSEAEAALTVRLLEATKSTNYL